MDSTLWCILVLVSLVQGFPQSSHRRFHNDVRDTGAYGASSYQSLGIQPDASNSRSLDTPNISFLVFSKGTIK